MAFSVRILFATAIVYTVNAGVLTGHHDSFAPSGLSVPPVAYGPPSQSFGAPLTGVEGGYVEDHHSHLSHGAAAGAFSDHGSFSGGHLDTSGGSVADFGASGHYDGHGHGHLHGAAVGGPRVIGTSVSVGRPLEHATQYELQSVVQNVIRRIPVEVTRHVKVAVPHPVPVPVPKEVKVPVPQPYPVHVDVVKHVPYPVYKTQHVEVERPVPVEVVRQVPVEVIRKVPVPVERPYEVIRKVPVPIEKHVHVPYAVWKPYPLHIIKHVTHYKKKHCCW